MTSLYVFKSIKPVHKADDLINITLSKTQRKTPNEVHPGYQIQRIRTFYIRKVKFCSDAFTEKLKETLNGFPKLNDIHPFFADWLNVLYDKDHYKIALGQINVVVNIIEKVEKDYIKLMKFADSLYRCKTLKVAAMGRMCTAVRKLRPSLEYLEEIRKHISRLPSVDPFAPSILLFGFPNVGKSSFINQITKANVEVSPMPFSTQNLFIGHTEYQNVKIQVIDSPGVLNRALEHRNTIEMQSVTALAHLKTLVLFIVDISETCGYQLADQLQLFETLKPLFAKKPVVIALNKVDLSPMEEMSADNRQQLEAFHAANEQVTVIQLSSKSQELVAAGKDLICQQLMDFRIAGRKEAGQLKSDEDYYVGVRTVQPTKARKNVNVVPMIPESVLREREEGPAPPRKTLKDLQEEFGGAGVFNFPLQEHFILEKNEWKYDIVPEIMDGKNVWDYVDPDIEKKLQELEEEELNHGIEEEIIVDADTLNDIETLKQVKTTRNLIQLQSKLKLQTRLKKMAPDFSSVKKRLEEKGLGTQEALAKVHSNYLKRRRAGKEESDNEGMELESTKPNDSLRTRRSETQERNRSVSQRAQWSKPDKPVEQRRRRIQKQTLKRGQSGDGDHRIIVKKPRHLFSGKRGIGKAERR